MNTRMRHNIYQRHYCRCRVEYNPGDGKSKTPTQAQVDPEEKKDCSRKKIGLGEIGVSLI